jgi:hypothetical protein
LNRELGMTTVDIARLIKDFPVGCKQIFVARSGDSGRQQLRNGERESSISGCFGVSGFPLLWE